MVVPDTDESRFFASVTAPVAAVLVAVRVAVGPEAVVDDREVVDVLEGAVPEAVVGFLAAAVAAAAVVLVLGLLGELGVPLAAAVEVRRAAVVAPESDVRFFSSSETEGRERCERVEAAVDGRLVVVVVVPVVVRDAGLLTVPAALVRVVELVVEPVVDLVGPVPEAAGRRVVEVAVAAVRRVAVVPVADFFSAEAFGEVGVAGDAGSGAAAEAAAGAGSDASSVAGADAAASVCWTTSKLSPSDMMGYAGSTVGSKGAEVDYRWVKTGLLLIYSG